MLIFADGCDYVNSSDFFLQNNWGLISPGSVFFATSFGVQSGSFGSMAGQHVGPAFVRNLSQRWSVDSAGGIIRLSLWFQAASSNVKPAGGLRAMALFIGNSDPSGSSAVPKGFSICVNTQGYVGISMIEANAQSNPAAKVLSNKDICDGQPHHIEFYIKVDSSGFTSNTQRNDYKLKVDGVTLIDQTSQGMYSSGNGNLNQWANGGLTLRLMPVSSTGLQFFDDIVLWDDQGSGMVGELEAPLKIKRLRPVDNGVTNQWSANAGSAYVAAGSYDVDSSYIVATTGRQLFDMSSLDIGTYAVKAIIPTWRAKLDDIGSRQVRAVAYTAQGSVAVGSSFNPTVGGYAQFQHEMMSKPAVSSAWLVADVNSAQFGIEIV